MFFLGKRRAIEINKSTNSIWLGDTNFRRGRFLFAELSFRFRPFERLGRPGSKLIAAQIRSECKGPKMEKLKMTKTTNILRCTVRQTLRSEFTSEPPDVELYMLCSDKIAAAAGKLELADVADLFNNHYPKFEKYLKESSSFDTKIVKAFKRQIEYEIYDFQVNPDSLPSEMRSRLESIRNWFVDDIPPDFLWIC